MPVHSVAWLPRTLPQRAACGHGLHGPDGPDWPAPGRPRDRGVPAGGGPLAHFFFDLSGREGCWARWNAGDAAYWLAGQPAAWRDAARVVAIGMCSIYASAVRRMLPGAHKRRGRSGDPE